MGVGGNRGIGTGGGGGGRVTSSRVCTRVVEVICMCGSVSFSFCNVSLTAREEL